MKNKNKFNSKNGISIETIGKKNSGPKDLTSVIEKLILRNEKSNNGNNIEPPNKIFARLQPISDTKNAVYQNIYCDKKVPRDFMRDEVFEPPFVLCDLCALTEPSFQFQIAELDRLLSSNEAVLGPDGKLISRNISPIGATNASSHGDENAINPEDLYCNICKYFLRYVFFLVGKWFHYRQILGKINFSTQKTLKYHMKHKHAENRLVYPCPDCTDTFSNSWSVFRHLFKVHRLVLQFNLLNVTSISFLRVLLIQFF